MRALVSICAATLAVAGSVTGAHAGTFGGFSADGQHYLERPRSICTPLSRTATGGAPSCAVSSASAVARGRFHPGKKQVGARAAYRTTLAGNNLQVVDNSSGKKVINWSSLDTIDRIVDTYVNPAKTMLAIVYVARMMGRSRTHVVGFRFAAGIGTSTTTTTTTTTTTKPIPLPPSVAGPKLTKKQKKRLRHYLRMARLQNRRRRSRAALGWIKKAEAIDADNPEAKFRRAVRLAHLHKDAELMALIKKMARSGRATGPRWWLELRFHKAFKRLLANAAFRKATGLDETVKRVRTTYEKLMGYGGHWEQSGKSCEREQINLRLRRGSNKFRMKIQSKCGSDEWVTKLDGRFAVDESNHSLVLRFPNPGRKDNVVRIALGHCKGHPNEPCLKTTIARMKMELLSVRR